MTADVVTQPLNADDAPPVDAQASRRHRRRRRSRAHSRLKIVGWSLAAAGLVVLAIGALLGIRYLPYLDRARDAKATAQQLAAAIHSAGVGLSQQDLDSLSAQVTDLDSQLQPFRDVLANDPVVGLARSVGPLREQIDAADDTVTAADDLVQAAKLGIGLGQQYVDIRTQSGAAGGSVQASLVQLMATSSTGVDQINTLLEDAQAHLDLVPPSAIGQVIDARNLMVGPLAQYAPVLKSYASVDGALPAILGWGGQKRYLVLAEDPAELRPQGGFAGTYGIVTFQDGRLVSHDFHDIYDLDLKPGLPYQEPPAGLLGHLLGSSRSWQLADSLWSPDLPTAAQDAMRLYTLESGGDTVDGLIVLTTYALDDLLKVTGPVTVADYGVTVAPGDVTLTSLALTRNSSDPNVNRKQFLQELADAALDKLEALPADKWPQLMTQFQDIGERRLAEVWFTDSQAEALVAGTTWGGEVLQTPGDYLYVVDSNVAPTSKYNLAVTRTTQLAVHIDQFGNALNTLRLGWQNDSMNSGEPFDSLRTYSTGTGGIYGNYVRVLTPDRSRLQSVSGGSYSEVTGPETIGSVADRTSFANYLAVPPGNASISYSWISPYVVNGNQGLGSDGVGIYSLTIQKQPGMTDEPVSVTVTVPQGATITSASAGMSVSGQTATYSGTLTADTQIAVRYIAH